MRFRRTGGLVPPAFVAMAALLPAPAGSQGSAAPGVQADQAVYQAECGLCHAAGGTGTLMLQRRLGTDKAVLSSRGDLRADYIRYAVRRGINSMPPLTRVEVTNAQLAQIVRYLAATPQERSK